MKSRLPSKVILLNIFKCLLIFYASYFTISSICFACYRLQNFDGKIPFDFEAWIHLADCCSQFSSQEMVNFISMKLSFSVSGLVYGLVVRDHVWDYALTITVFHTAFSCLVMLSFPLNWSWWVCIAFAALLMTVLGELAALVLRLKFGNKVNPVLTSGGEHSNFLFRKS